MWLAKEPHYREMSSRTFHYAILLRKLFSAEEIELCLAFISILDPNFPVSNNDFNRYQLYDLMAVVIICL